MDEGRGFLDGATPETPKRAVGRPKGEYDEEMASKICDAISAGMTMREIEKLPGFPGCSTMYRWLRLYPDFNEHYHMAQHWRSECLADDILQIADDKTGDYEIEAVMGGSGSTEIVDEDAPQAPLLRLKVNGTALGRSKQQIDTRFKLMANMSPAKWGARAPAPAAAPAPTIIVIPTPPPAALPGDNAKQITATVIDPLRDAIEAWKKKG